MAKKTITTAKATPPVPNKKAGKKVIEAKPVKTAKPAKASRPKISIKDVVNVVKGIIPAQYVDTLKPQVEKKSGLYLDTWMPDFEIKPNTSLYLDTWIAADVLKKTKKPGIYADTWVPAENIKVKTRRGK